MYFKIIVVFVGMFYGSACISSHTYDVDNITDLIEALYGTPVYDEQHKAMEKLDLMLIKHIASGSRHNFLLSPLALKLAVCLLTKMAAGNTRSELLSVLGFDLDESNMHKYTMITSTLNRNYPAYVGFGSQIFVSDEVELKQTAINTADSVFSTLLKTINIRDSFEATTKINSWLLNITQGFFFDSFNENDVRGMSMLVLNTLYFKSNFRHNFMRNDTKIEQFYISPSVTKDVTFMHVADYYRYADSKAFDAKIVGMSYTHVYVIYFIVPNTLMGLPYVLNNLHILGTELNKASKTNVDVILPKFKLDYTSRLTGILKKLGVKQAFQNEAMFPNLGTNKLPYKRLKISKIMQRFDFDINEYGSGVDRPSDAVHLRGPIQITAKVVGNRPFLFVLEDGVTKQVLLIGRISDPSVSQGYFEVV